MTTVASTLPSKTAIFAVGPALGHVSRLYRVAQRLRVICDVAITFVTPAHGRCATQIVGKDFEIIEVPISESAKKMPAYEFAVGFEAVLAARAPDVIVQDMCPLRWTSATRFPDLPRVIVTNYFLTRIVKARTVQAAKFENISEQLNRHRRRRGLPALQSVFNLYEADKTLLADPLSLISRRSALPPRYHCCGPCSWSPKGDLPPELASVSDAMVLAMGSTGRGAFRRETIERIAHWSGCGGSIYVGNKVEEVSRSGIVDHSYDWLPLKKLLAGSRIAISQGGAGSTYLALEAGVPVIVVPTHRNQKILGAELESAGLGLFLSDTESLGKLDHADYDAIFAKVQAFADEQKQQDGAGEIANHIAGCL